MSIRLLHLNINVNNSGRHPASWRVADDPLGFLKLDYYENIGRLAEQGKLDAVFFSDEFDYGQPGVSRPWQALDPLIPLTAIARVTKHIGLVATVSSSFNDPYNIARRIASLDYVSGGRAAWNVVTTRNEHVARLFGPDKLPDHNERYARARESIEVVRGLWGSWQADAVIADQSSGKFVDTTRIHPFEFSGEYFQVQGALNVPPSPQGQPVLLQAGGSAPGIETAARYADAVFCVHHTLTAAQDFYREVKSKAAAWGRNPDKIFILPGLFPVLGSTEAEAIQRKEWLDETAGFRQELGALSKAVGLPAEELVLDEPLPWDKLNLSDSPFRSVGFLSALLDLARREKLTVREILKRNPSGHRVIVGTPEQVADSIEEWFTQRGADGFNLNTDFFPQGLESIVEHLIPELQRRGLFRREYSHSTLRGNLGLDIPADHRHE